MKKILGVLVVLTFFLMGCGDQNNEGKDGDQIMDGAVLYDCQGESVQAVFNNDVVPATTQLIFVDRDKVEVVLPSVEAASGAKYSDGSIVFWTQQNEAILSMEGSEKSLSCTMMDSTNDMADVTIDENGNEITPGCQTWYDGCNTCQVGEPGMPMACTRRFCDPETMEPARCLDEDVVNEAKKVCADAGGVWSEEYNSCFEDPATMAGEGEK